MVGRSYEEFAKELEGKYFAFTWTDHDINYEGSCLAVFQLKEGKLRGRINGGMPAEVMESQSYELTQKAIEELIEHQIKEVYSETGGSREIFGLKRYEDNPEELNEDGEIDEWSQLEGICRDSEYYNLLTEKGIKVKFIDYQQRKISD